MNVRLIEAVFLAWPIVVAALTWGIGPRRALLVGLFGGHLFLPVAELNMDVMGLSLPLNRWNVTAIALILGPLIFDRRTILRARPNWLDLPILLYYLAPAIGLMTGMPGTSGYVQFRMMGGGLIWVVPYVMGRIYFSRGDGPAAVAIALVIAGLSYIPVCLYEEIAGPKNFLAVRIYGIPNDEGMVNRMGGWRPEAFLKDGIAVAGWMALTTVMAAWLWLGGWRPGRWPSWAPTLALLLTTLSCRGLYGYFILGIGLVTVVLTRWARSRVVLAVLLVIPLIYLGSRTTGAWDGNNVVRWAEELTGRSSSIDYRFRAEDEVVRKVMEYNPFFGGGGDTWQAKLSHGLDCRWLVILWAGGFVGLALHLITFQILPVVLALSRPRGRPDGRQAASPSWGLACWCSLQMIDSLQNSSYFTPTSLVAGTLIGFAGCKVSDVFEARPAGGSRDLHRRSSPVALIVTVVILIGIEILGRWRGPGPTPIHHPNLEDGKRNTPP